nr:acyloxyacyl hydrolase [Sporomusa sphaeroides]
MTSLSGNPYCYAADSNLELEWDQLTPHGKNRNLNTVSLHILKKFPEAHNRSIYRGITITQPRGDINWENQNRNSSAVGVGPVYLLRYEKDQPGKLSAAFDMSGGFIIYNKKFPAGGQYYNFMWRIGPRFIYKITENSSVNLGYTLMHVSNGLRTHNPGYDAHGVSLSFVTKF